MLELIILKNLTSQKILHNKFKFHYIYIHVSIEWSDKSPST